MKLVQHIAYISGVFLGLYILLLAYGVVPSKLDNKDHKMTRTIKVLGFFVLISSIVRLLQTWL